MSQPILTSMIIVGEVFTPTSCSSLWTTAATCVNALSGISFNCSNLTLEGISICSETTAPAGSPGTGSIWLRAANCNNSTLSIYTDTGWKQAMYVDNQGGGGGGGGENPPANGWFAGTQTYYINSQATTLDENGDGVWNGEYYFAGSLANGVIGGVYYQGGYQATGVVDGVYYYYGSPATGIHGGVHYTAGVPSTGVYSGVYYVSGSPGTGMNSGLLYSSGSLYTGISGGYYFISGNLATGSDNVNYYINGICTTLDTTGSGVWNGACYNGGSLYTGLDGETCTIYYQNGYIGSGWYTSTYYISGNATELNSSGTGTYNSLYYFNGSILNGSNGSNYYIAGVCTTLDTTGNGTWNELRYVDGSLANGSYYGAYHINGVSTTLDENGNGFWNTIKYCSGAIYQTPIICKNTTTIGGNETLSYSIWTGNYANASCVVVNYQVDTGSFDTYGAPIVTCGSCCYGNLDSGGSACKHVCGSIFPTSYGSAWFSTPAVVVYNTNSSDVTSAFCCCTY